MRIQLPNATPTPGGMGATGGGQRRGNRPMPTQAFAQGVQAVGGPMPQLMPQQAPRPFPAAPGAGASGGFSAYGGGMVNAQAVDFTPMNSMARPSGDTMPQSDQPWQMSAINPNQSLTGQQIMPGDSSSTQQAQGWTQGAGQRYNDFQFQPFRGMDPMDFGQARQGLTDASTQMQGLGYDWSGANAQYGAGRDALTAGRDAADAAADTARGQYGGLLSALGGGGFGVSSGGQARADTGRFNQELDAAMQGLEGPDRTKLAADALGLMEERSTPGFERSLRGVMAKNAAMGRRGSGITTNELGDVTLARERELALARRELSNQAAGQTLADRLAVSEAQRGIAGQRFGGEQFNAQMADSAAGRSLSASMAAANNRLQALNLERGVIGDQYAMGRDRYNMGRDAAEYETTMGDRLTGQQRDNVRLGQDQASFGRNIAMDRAGLVRDDYTARRTERDAARGDEYDQLGVTRNRFGDFQNFLGNERQNDANRRQEARGERSWQYGLQRDAMDDDFRRANFEEQLRNNRFNRAGGYAGMGFGQSPTGAYQNLGQYYGQQANDWYTLAGEAANYMGQRGRRSGASGGQRP